MQEEEQQEVQEEEEEEGRMQGGEGPYCASSWSKWRSAACFRGRPR